MPAPAKPQSNILLSRIKESKFDSNLLSQIDTELHQQQYLSQKEETLVGSQYSPKTFNEKEIVFQRSRLADTAERNLFSTGVPRAPFEESELATKANQSGFGKETRGKKAKPQMQVRNGKLLLVK